MLGDLSGKKALVTGAGTKGGMGATIAEVLARQGADVAVTDLMLSGAAEVADGIGGVETLVLELDVASPASVAAAFEHVMSEWGQLDILVNNAGVMGSLDGADQEQNWDATLEINLKGTVRCCNAVLPTMRERRYGKIVNIASIAGHAARGPGGAYGASKAAVLRYTKGLAVEVGAYSINVNAICPGGVWTTMQQTSFELPDLFDPDLTGLAPYEAFVEYYRRITPLQRIQSAEDVGKAVAFLASDDAANITGQCLHVDGGVIRT